VSTSNVRGGTITLGSDDARRVKGKETYCTKSLAATVPVERGGAKKENVRTRVPETVEKGSTGRPLSDAGARRKTIVKSHAIQGGLKGDTKGETPCGVLPRKVIKLNWVGKR